MAKLKTETTPRKRGVANNTEELPRRRSAARPIESVPREVILNAQESPVRTADGAFFMVDLALQFGDTVIIAGWMSHGSEIQIEHATCQVRSPREDASEAIGHAAEGFVIVCEAPDLSTFSLELVTRSRTFSVPLHISVPRNDADIRALAGAITPNLSELLPFLIRSKALGCLLVSLCLPLEDTLRNHINGYIDDARAFTGFGTISYGWVLAPQNAELWLVGGDGSWRSLKDAERYNRADIDIAFRDAFGPLTAGAGFFSSLPMDTMSSSRVLIVSIDSRGARIIAERHAQPMSNDLHAYLRWAFQLPTYRSRIGLRLEKHDGALLDVLSNTARSKLPSAHDEWTYGETATTPSVSIVIRLSERVDHIEHQLVGFSADTDFLDGTTELIYVIDDQTLVEPAREVAATLAGVYGVPFRLIWGSAQRGCSGAANLGLKLAKGAVTIFLGSNVFPRNTGWTSEMGKVLSEHPNMAALGARLISTDGGIAHLGLVASLDQRSGTWGYRVPKRGLEIPASIGLAFCQVPAASAACLAVRTADARAVCGFDEGYVIEEFAAADLCYKLRLKGRDVFVLTHTEHVQLSPARVPIEESLRDSLGQFNAWRHFKKWGDLFQEMIKD